MGPPADDHQIIAALLGECHDGLQGALDDHAEVEVNEVGVGDVLWIEEGQLVVRGVGSGLFELRPSGSIDLNDVGVDRTYLVCDADQPRVPGRKPQEHPVEAVNAGVGLALHGAGGDTGIGERGVGRHDGMKQGQARGRGAAMLS